MLLTVAALLVSPLAADAEQATGSSSASSGSTSGSTADSETGLAAGALCSPSSVTIGDGTDTSVPDYGVATWVGGDMYVGAPSTASDGTVNTAYGKDAATPVSSYAVEAEGLTLVQGKLAIKSVKNSWSNRGFRFGIVGFGAQYRGEEGSDTLVVAGLSSASKITLADYDGNDVNALGYGATGRGWIGKDPTYGDNAYYNAQIAGTRSRAMGTDGWSKQVESVYNYTGDGTVTWTGSNANPLTGVRIVKNGTATTSDLSGYGQTVASQSATLAAVAANGTVTESAAPDDAAYWRYKYNSNTINYQFVFDSSNREKLLTFTGDGSSVLQVFDVPASYLSDTGQDGTVYRGVDFDFENIPSGASVVVNVVADTTGSSTGNISFHSGWRFWWNGNEIGDGYVDAGIGDGTVTDEDRADYSTAAKSIMWNFAGLASSETLTIYGGQYNSGKSGDDPAAAMLGSIMVPYGSFDDHVTTNGRVWVGGDFMMDNPTVAATFGKGVGEGDSASVIDMDQERHNFPWSGSVSTSCSSIGWSKTGSDGTVPEGTKWAVYGTLDDAKSSTNAILTVTDNVVSSGDWNTATGELELHNLAQGAAYYIREVATADGYDLNTNIYRIETGADSGTVVTRIAAIYTTDSSNDSSASSATRIWAASDSSGTFTYPADDEAALIDSDGRIVNKLSTGGISWTKVDATNQQAIAGATFAVQQFADGAYADVDATITADGGQYQVAGLPAGHWYRIVETAAPDGYQADVDSAYYFYVGAGTASGTASVSVTVGSATYAAGTFYHDTTANFDAQTGAPVTTTAMESNTIANDRVPGSVSWTKISSDRADTAPLAGSEWTITYYSYNGEGTDDYAYNGKSYTITDCTADGSCTFADVDGETPYPAWAKDVDATTGKFSLTGLAWGKYVVAEKTAPTGYAKTDQTWTFLIGGDAVKTAMGDSGSTDSAGEASSTSTSASADSTFAEQSDSFTVDLGDIENTPGIVLPSAGGSGNARLVVIAGVGITLLALLGLAFLLRRRN
ncbi:SpaA isopeptide-forming pilin-related protein [Bifidobacterium choloepi]|uniref:Gram-positive cocci surface proteins LPxTG domain-containing protein n=1 Tax=Bifidobacterium choloepi TaxID=2614131 RepID=A0A6I5N7B5_9BIFI|nr:SpaA isopeptide-forming pilin-related protein [Bifidobacterium choloepi]NEG69731.1 hypothetical protein [Bifidobacterium choloepi]